MKLKIVVLAKQVPDTRNVGKDAMTAEGTVNRAALPAIFNPEDLNALEQALRLKEQHPGSTVGLLTMGPPRAAEPQLMPATCFLIGTPAAIRDSVEAQTEAWEVEPLLSKVSDTQRIA